MEHAVEVDYNNFVNLAVAAIAVSVALMLAIPSNGKKPPPAEKFISKAEDISRWLETQENPENEGLVSVKNEEVVDSHPFFHHDSGNESTCVDYEFDDEVFLRPASPIFERRQDFPFRAMTPTPSIADSSISIRQTKWEDVPQGSWSSLDFSNLRIRKVKQDSKRFYVVYRKNMN